MHILALLAGLAIVDAYIWPSPQLDALEALRWNGPNLTFASFVQPCDLFIADFSVGSGRSNAADWIRTAYHDVATHNVTDGTGGLDASIRFAEEQALPANAGTGFSNTLLVLGPLATQYVSSTSLPSRISSGGPEIEFRGGRVDAVEPNAPGVPLPQQSLEDHIAAFSRQGFTSTEMIQLVACGHTFGGVQHDAFPTIVPELNDTNDTESVAHFDSTFIHFDNNITTEYISVITQNPLVVGLNDTTNSDKRIFGSDGNSTMSSFADSVDLFASTCAVVFAKMLNTVPQGVELTEVINPLPVKPSDLSLILAGDTLQFSGQVRFWNMTEDPNRAVVLLWEDHVGGTNNATLNFTTVTIGNGGRSTAAWYTFSPSGESSFLSLDTVAGITSMSFAVDNIIEDQDGVGFAVQDDVVFSSSSCCCTGGGDLVRNDVAPTLVYLQFESLDDTGRPVVVDIGIPPPNSSSMENTTAYTIWSVGLPFLQTLPAGFVASLGVEIDGVNSTRSGPVKLVDFEPCP
ncbi:heme peroxidase [Mycena galopus ATCC 62051]|nr:heme peroxidase [Mycena galopus ATCC 62051]